MYGYSGTDMIFNGRETDKQYKAQVELFKKIDKKKVKKAYEEAYNDLIWCISQPTIKPLSNDTIDSLIESSRAFTRKYVDEWLYKPLTKREEMWNDILSFGDCEHAKYVKANKENYQTFVKECADNNIFETDGYNIRVSDWWYEENYRIFQIYHKPAGLICMNQVCKIVTKDTIIDNLSPMRWDLFLEGRRMLRLTSRKNLEEGMSNFRAHVPCLLGV